MTLLDDILLKVEALSAEDRVRLKHVLDAWTAAPRTPPQPPQSQPRATPAQIDEALRRHGVVVTVPSNPVPLEPFEPVPFTGKPVSQILIEDRR
ncbi:MAG TPA: hypothetical protein VK324_08680 [Tepidisphaeraceae bacterium]|nr:hypothetical protein [Tepidisphaeraceae bacterium]